MNFWTFLVVVGAGWLAFEYGLHKHRRHRERRIVGIKVVFLKENGMSMIVGQPTPFHVVAFDKDGNAGPMPPTLAVSTDNGTATVASDGTSGAETPATAGPVNVKATLTLADGTVFTDTGTDTAVVPFVVAGIKVVLGS